MIFSIPFGKVSGNAYRETSSLFINGVTLPVAVTRCTETFSEERDINLSEKQTHMLVMLRFFDECTTQFRYLKTENSKITTAKNKNGFTMNGDFVCLENIGKEVPMDIEQVPQVSEE